MGMQGRMVEGLGCICGYVRYVYVGPHFDSDCGVLVHLRRDPARPCTFHVLLCGAIRTNEVDGARRKNAEEEEQSGQQVGSKMNSVITPWPAAAASAAGASASTLEMTSRTSGSACVLVLTRWRGPGYEGPRGATMGAT